MYEITEEFISEWAEREEGRFPAIVDTLCPYTGVPTAFSLQGWRYVGEVETWTVRAECAGSDEGAAFFWVPDRLSPDGGPAPASRLFMHPTPKFIRRPLEGVSMIREFDVALQRAYAASVNVYNAQEWTGTVVVCRRTLEDIARVLLPADRQKISLPLQIQALSKRKDLAQPVQVLADALKRSSNLGPYFDLEKTPDRDTATMVIELLDYLLEYLFVVPRRVQELKQRIEELDVENSGAESVAREA